MRCAPAIVSTNYKGGVGKTTSSRVLAQAIAEMPEFNQGKPVLIVDLDPQGNTSRRWDLLQTLPTGTHIPKPHPGLVDSGGTEYSSICDLWLGLLGLGQGVAPEPYTTSNSMIEVVPVHEELMGDAMLVPRADRPKLGLLMREWLRSDYIAERYCAVLLDTQPSKTPLIDAALMAATHVYIPFIPEPQAVEGVYSIISYVYAKTQQRGNDVPLEILGLLPSMVQQTSLHKLHLKRLEKNPAFGRYLMPVMLCRRIGYAETDDWHNTPDQVTDLEGTKIAIEARKFARYIVERLEATAAQLERHA